MHHPLRTQFVRLCCISHFSPVHVDPLCGEADAHVAVAALGDDGHLEVVDSAGGGDGVRGAHRAGVLVRLAVAAVLHAQVALRQPDEVVLVLVRPRPGIMITGTLGAEFSPLHRMHHTNE